MGHFEWVGERDHKSEGRVFDVVKSCAIAGRSFLFYPRDKLIFPAVPGNVCSHWDGDFFLGFFKGAGFERIFCKVGLIKFICFI